MKRPRNDRILAILLGSLPAALPMSAALADDDCDGIMSNQGIVELVVGADINDINDDYGTTTLASIEIDVSDPDDGVRLYLLQLPEGWDEDEFEQWFDDDNDPRIAEAELNYQGETAEGGQTESFYFNVAPSAYPEQYAWGLIGLEAAHQSSTGAGIVVALLDTGAEADHEALVGHIVPGGFNFVDGNTDTSDVGSFSDRMVGHGTFMAGIVAMVAPDAELLIIQVLDGDGQSGGQFRVAQGIYYAVQHGADVINLSLAMTCEQKILEDAVTYARQSGTVVVAAAGNLDQPEVMFPAHDEYTIGVASTDIDDRKSEFSNYGGHVSISAPGTDIVSSVPNNAYGQWQGTSMSVSFVAGAAVLLKAVNPSASPDDIEEILGDAADDVDPEYDGLLGAGRLNIPAALPPDDNLPDLKQVGSVSAAGLLILLGSWGPCGDGADCPADLNDDCAVGGVELPAWLSGLRLPARTFGYLG